LLYCRLVRCLVPTFSQTPEFFSSPSQGGSHPEVVQLNQSQANVSADMRGMSPDHHTLSSRGDEFRAGQSSPKIEIHTGAL
jgi:hypothetical protein